MLFAFCLTQISLSAQEYDLNKYKYRYQNNRGFTTSFDIRGDGELSTVKYKDNDTIAESVNINDINNRAFNYRLGLFYFSNTNTDRLQRETSLFLNSRANFNQNGSGRKLNDSLVSSQANNASNYDNSVIYNQLNRFYKPNNSFTYLSYGGSGSINGSNFFNSRSTSGDFNQKINRNRLQANLSIGKGKGRIENVSDAVSAMFIIKDLQEKGGLGQLSDVQTELIAQGITTARNRRFIDFRFRIIDQIALLDSFFTLAGAKPDNDLIYYTTLYDNWFYATNFFRGSGKRFTYSLSNSASYDKFTNTLEESIGRDYTYINTINTDLYNALNLEYTSSKQLSLYHERSFIISAQSGLRHQTDLAERKDSFQISLPYSERSSKFKNGDAVISTIDLTYSQLYQPNTRTYLRWSASANYLQQNSLLGLRVSNPAKENNVLQTLGANFNLNFFHFFSPRLSIYANANIRANALLSSRQREIIYAPNNLLNFESNNRAIGGGVGFSAGLVYALF